MAAANFRWVGDEECEGGWRVLGCRDIGLVLYSDVLLLSGNGVAR